MFFSAITWVKSESTEINDHPCLITASQDGLITLWKIFSSNALNRSENKKEINNLEADILCSFDSKVTHSSSLHYHPVTSSTGLLTYMLLHVKRIEHNYPGSLICQNVI